MYCKKCGKEITDDTSFCPACGTPTSEHAVLSQSKPIIPKMSQKEKTLKYAAFFAGALSVGYIFTLAIIGISSEFEVLEDLIEVKGGSLYSMAFSLAISDNKTLLTILAIVLMFSRVILAIKSYIVPFFKRTFSENKVYTIVNNIGASAVTLYVMFGIFPKDSNLTFNTDGYLYFIFVILFEIFAAITYFLAAKSEDAAYYGFEKK